MLKGGERELLKDQAGAPRRGMGQGGSSNALFAGARIASVPRANWAIQQKLNAGTKQVVGAAGVASVELLDREARDKQEATRRKVEDQDSASALAMQIARMKLKDSTFLAGGSDLYKAFSWFDTDRSGALDKEELRNAFKVLKVPVTPDTVDSIVAQFDCDGTGQCDYRAFIQKLFPRDAALYKPRFR